MNSGFRLAVFCGAVVACPGLALADVNGTTTLAANTALKLDSGASASSGGDILWNGTTIAPQGKARAYNLGNLEQIGFNTLTKAVLDGVKAIASSAPIPASKLVAGDVFAVYSNGGNAAKVLVQSNSGGSITLQFVTFIVALPAGPAITAIQNNSSRIAAGYPSYGIAPSSIFVVVGTGLSDSGPPVLQSSADPGIPLTLNGTSISVTVNGTTVQPPIYYTSPIQVAAVLPARTPIGTGTLTVTYRGTTSAPAAIKVVPAALGINTYYTNSGVATDAATGALLTYSNSGTPGETIVLWTSGLGADPEDSDTILSASPHSVETPLKIYIGGVPATILYQGSAGYPGVNQINLAIPDSAPSGCWISVVAVAGGVPSNTATLPINKGGGACFDVVSGLNGDQIAPPGGQTLRSALVALIQTNTPARDGSRTITSSTDAAFEKYTGIYKPANSLSPGGCVINYPNPVEIPSITGLDPGTIMLTGPGGLNVKLALQFGINGAFFAMLPQGAIPQSGGSFTFSGSGGADVGAFTSTITFTNPLLTWTNQADAATVHRSNDLTVTWTGGNPGSYVFISGASTDVGARLTLGFTCMEKIEAGKFTVPSYILSALPAGPGATELQNAVFQPLMPSGVDVGVADGTVSFSVSSRFQ